MRNSGRALSESFLLHGMLAGFIIVTAGLFTPPPKIIRLDFNMFAQPADPPPKAAEATLPALPPIADPPAPAPQPQAAAPRVPVKKIQPTLKKTTPKVAAVEPDPAPAPMPDTGDNAIAQLPAQGDTATVAADPSPVANVRTANSPPMHADEEYRRANFAKIRESILANLRYPTIARRQGWSGKVDVAFLIAPDGNISELRIQTSSGYSMLDEQALDAIRRAAPFTPPRIAALLVMPVTFQLN